MPSSRIIGRPSFAERRFRCCARGSVGTALACGLLLACSRPRENEPHPAPAEPAATALLAAPSAPLEPPTAAPAAKDDTPPPAEPANGPPPPPPRTLTALGSVSAERLLDEVRRLGGKGTFVNAWASWCGPCKHEIPMLQKLAAQLEPSGLHVLLVSLDEPGDREKAASFLREQHITLTSYLAERPLGPFKQGMNPRWPGMLPASFLYDATGALRYFWGGEAFESEISPVLGAFVAGRPISGEATPAVAPEGEAH